MTVPNEPSVTPSQPEDLVKLPWNRHCVVVAGPGTGKSWVIANRVEWVSEHSDLKTSDIAVLTLTRSTARELQQSVGRAHVGTFHSFSLQQLNAIGASVRRRVVDPWEQNNLVIPDLQLLLGHHHLRKNVVQDFLTRLGAGFRENQTVVPELTPIEMELRERWLFLREFMEFQLFDELAYNLLQHLQSGGTLIAAPRLILVDEYQDLTPSELVLLRQIAAKHESAVFVCGDDRQSIFGFRDADPLALNNFCRVYSLDQPDYLSVTRRCPAAVCNFAEAVATQIPPVPGLSGRPPLQPHPDLPPGDVRVRTFPSTVSEADWVHSQIRRLLDEGEPSHEIMVIVPHSIDVYLTFLGRAACRDGSGITYYDTRISDPACEVVEFHALHAFCRLAEDMNDHLAWRTLIQIAHGWGPAFLQRVLGATATTFAAALRGVAALDDRAGSLVRSIEHTVETLRRSERIEEACSPVTAWLRDAAGVANPDWSPVFRLPELERLSSPLPAEDQAQSAVQCAEQFGVESMASALLSASSAQRADRARGEREIAVHTVYQAKGLQAKHVFVVGAFAQAFVNKNNPADGIRLLYVAVTRAKEALTISVGRYIRGRDNPLSPRLRVNAVQLSPHVVEAAQRAGIAIEG